MTAETEVCNGEVSEVAGIEGESEFKARSLQDLSKPELNGIGNHDQANDPEDSYVSVADVGGRSPDSKDMDAVDGSPRHESCAPVELSGIELDALNGNQEGANVGKHDKSEGGDESFTLVNGSPDVQVTSIVDGTGDHDTFEEENKCLEELNDQNGKREINPTERGIGNAASTNENPLVANGILVGVQGSVHDEDEIRVKLATSNPESRVESEIKKAEDSGGEIEISEDAEAAKFEDQNGKIGVVAEAKLDKVEDQLVSEASPGVKENQESKVSNLGLVADSGEEEEPKSLLSPLNKQETVEDEDELASDKEAMQDQKCDIDNESDIQCGMDKDEVVVSNAVKSLDGNGATSQIEGSVLDEDETRVKLATRKPECWVESEIKKAEDSDGNIESSEEAEASKVEDQNGNIGVVAEAKLDKVEDQLVSEASPGVEENQESKVSNLGLVADSGKEEKPKSLFSPLNKQETVEDEQDHKCDIDIESNIQCGIDKDKVVVSNADFNVETACDEVLEGKDEEIYGVSHVEGSIMYPDDAVKSLDGNGATPQIEGSVHDEDETRVKLATRKPECRVKSEIKKAEDSGGNIERSEEAEAAKVEDQNGNIGVVAEAKLGKVEDQLVSEASPGVEENQESKVSNLGLVADSGKEEKPMSLLSPLNKQETVEDEQDHKCDIDIESNIQCGMDKDKLATRKPECRIESEIKKAEDPDGEIERSEEAEAAKVEDQNGKIGVVVEAKLDKVSEASPGVEENQEYKVSNLGLVAHSGEEEERKSLLSPLNKPETVEDEDESASDKEAMQDHKCDIFTETNHQCWMDKDKVVVSNADFNVETACDEVLEGKDEEICSVSHVEGSIMHPDDAVKSRDGNGATPQISVSERDAGASGPTQNKSASNAQVHRPTAEVQISDAETVGVKSSLPVDGSESEILGNELVHLHSFETCTINGVSSGSDSEIRTVVSNEKEPILQGCELSGDSEDDHNPPISAVKMEPEADNSSAAEHVSVTSDQDATSATDVLVSFVVDKGASKSMSADVKDMVDGANGSDDETLLYAKNGDTGNSHSVDISKASPESSSDTVTGEDVSGITVTKPFNFFVRIPRYSDEKLQEQIKIAELEVDKKTKLRDSIQAQIQDIRARNQSHGVDYEHAKGEDRSVRKLLKEKRTEIDSLKSVINKAKNATSVEDLNSRIKSIEYKIQHETLPLKEEKQFIHEIKQLKQQREQLSSSKCSQNDIQQALEQREQAEERLKILSKELGNLKGTASKAQTACDEAESKYNVEHKKVRELQAQYKAADDVRQEAYAKFLCLSKERSQKRKNFSKFKNDSASATYYAFTDDREALYCHCVNEVENFMELWNGNDEFRKEYVRLNTRSTVRRFGTLDGRSLGPDEKPPILPSYVSERNNKVVSMPADADSVSKSPTMELKPETKIENVSSDIHSSKKKETESKKKTVTTKGLAKSKLVNNLDAVSGMDEVQEEEEEPVKTKEDLELMRIAEKIRRGEAEAKLNEQRRLEEIAKAKEARERKQRRDEKAQKREELRAKNEAEQREKEREKKLRKKERKKAASASASASADMQDDASSITCLDISKEEASMQVNDVSTKKSKTSQVTVSRQNKMKSVPPPSLRNRNRKKWQQWMWVSLIILVALVLLWLGNMGVFSSVNSKLQGTGF